MADILLVSSQTGKGFDQLEERMKVYMADPYVLVPKLFEFLQQQKLRNLDDAFKIPRNFVNNFCTICGDIETRIFLCCFELWKYRQKT